MLFLLFCRILRLPLFFKKIARVIVRGAIYIYCKIVHRAEIIGKENIHKNENFIFCGNHRNYLDPPLMVATVGRHVRFMAKEELIKNPFFAFLGIVFDGIYVKRDSKDVTALKTTLKALKEGESIALFPEGTRNGMEKNGGKLKNGAAYMALKTGAKIVPIGIQGPAKPFTKNVIIYGEPLDFSRYCSEKVDKEIENKVSEELKQAIIALTNKQI